MEELKGTSEETTIHDPATYRAMSEPYESLNAAGQAMQAFYDDVRELRKKHKIADVLLIMRVTAGETEQPIIYSLHIGDELQETPMVHFAMAFAQKHHEERIARIRKQVQGIQ